VAGPATGHRNGAWGALCGVRPGGCGVTPQVVDTVDTIRGRRDAY